MRQPASSKAMMKVTRATLKSSRPFSKQPGIPAFRFDNWLATGACPCQKAAKARACAVHPLLALAVAVLAALAVMVVMQIGALDRLRAWGRMAAPPQDLHSGLSRLHDDDLSKLRAALPSQVYHRL